MIIIDAHTIGGVKRFPVYFAYFPLITSGKTTKQHHDQDIGIYPSYPDHPSFTYNSSVCGLSSLDFTTCAC